MHPLQEYPSLPPAAPPVVTVDGPEFFRQPARVLPAAGKDDTQPVLTMVSLTLSGGSLRMATSDRYRLTVADVPAQPRETDTEAAEPPEAVMVPARVLAQVAKHLGTYTGPIAIGTRAEEPSPLLTLNIGGAEITTDIYEGEHIKLDNHPPTQYRYAA